MVSSPATLTVAAYEAYCTSTLPHPCPHCHCSPRYAGGHWRWMLWAVGTRRRFWLRHVRCETCHTLETLFPPWLLPYEEWTLVVLQQAPDAALDAGRSFAGIAAEWLTAGQPGDGAAPGVGRDPGRTVHAKRKPRRDRMHVAEPVRDVKQAEAARAVNLMQPVGTDTMRKTFGYHAYHNGTDVAIIHDILNHSSPRITLRSIGIPRMTAIG